MYHVRCKSRRGYTAVAVCEICMAWRSTIIIKCLLAKRLKKAVETFVTLFDALDNLGKHLNSSIRNFVILINMKSNYFLLQLLK